MVTIIDFETIENDVTILEVRDYKISNRLLSTIFKPAKHSVLQRVN